MRPRHLGIALSLLVSSSAALAQPDDQRGAAPAAPAAAPVVVATPGVATCLLGLRPKAQEDSARTAARLFCDEVRGKGVAIGDLSDQAPAGGDTYRIDIEPLGSQLLVRVAHEAPLGTPRATRRLFLANYEEMNVAAGRLAEALVHDKPLSETATVTTVVRADTAPNQKKRGDTLVGVGLIGVSAPTVGVFAAPGAEGSLFYETPDIAVGASLAAAGGGGAGSGSGKLGYFAFSVGARHYLMQTDIAPYVGAGAAYTHLYLRSGEYGESGDKNGGLGGYLEGGVQLLRLHKHHLGAGLRVDAPLYRVEDRYAMPVTFNVTWLMQ
jgi:hypothetical protein